jgi:hypothetical protein
MSLSKRKRASGNSGPTETAELLQQQEQPKVPEVMSAAWIVGPWVSQSDIVIGQLVSRLVSCKDERFRPLVDIFPNGQMREYVRFILLKAFMMDTRGLLLSPSGPVDEVWHAHMLTPHLYTSMCCLLTGNPDPSTGVIGHDPARAHDADRATRLQRTLRLYRLVFGEDAPAQYWPAEAAADEPPPPAPGLVNIIFKTLTGETHMMKDREPGDLIEGLKAAYYDMVGTPPSQLRFIFRGKQLDDGRTLADYGISGGTPKIHVVLRMVGC